MENLIFILFACRSGEAACQIDGCGGRMDNAHHVDLDGAVEAELPGDPWHLIGCEHDTQAREHMIGKCEQAEKQQRCLHERRQTDCRHLLAPLIEAVGITTGNAEHIQQASDRHLNEQDAAALDILEEDLDYAVGKGNQT